MGKTVVDSFPAGESPVLKAFGIDKDKNVTTHEIELE